MEHGILPLLLVFLLSLTQCIAWQKERPVLESVDGHLIIWSAENKNVTIKTRGTGFLTVNDINLVESAHAAAHAARYIETWKNEFWQDLQTRVDRLASSVEGPNGLIRRVYGGSWRNRGGNSSSLPSDHENSGHDVNVQALTSRVNTLQDTVRKIRKKLRENKCSSNPCLNGGTCIRTYDGYQCLCSPSWQGSSCGLDVNECAIYAGTDLGCQNGATCVNTLGSYSCSCAAGWFGVHCASRTSACSASDSRELCGNGVCVDQKGTPLGYTCLCDQGWKAEGTNPACIVDVDECAGKHPVCSVNPEVECINLRGSFHCGSCPAGYSGNGYSCRDIDECLVDNGGCSTIPKVECRNIPGSRLCGPCPPGYSGNGDICSYVGSCRLNNGGCHPLATCIESPNAIVQCRCPLGYGGDGMGPNGCAISTLTSNPCMSNPCIHGNCISHGQTFLCQCNSGFTGINCAVAVNPCLPNPCKNNGICSKNPDNTFTCECTSAYKGPKCETAKSNCGGYIRDMAGTLSYPPDGRRDPNVKSCAFIFSTNHSMVLNVTFTRFKLGSTPTCRVNFLQLHDGISTADHLIGRFCGDKLPRNGSIISTHNNLYMWLNVHGTEADEGFTLHWNSTAPVCGGYLTADYGTISSPGTPGKYPLNRNCTWEISVAAGRRIQFHFFTLQIEAHPTCAKDYLQINETQGDRQIQLQRYCNHTQPPPLLTPGSSAILYFHSDGDTQDQGFQLSYSSVEGTPGCGGIHTASEGTISSPTINGNYDYGLYCTWKIQLPADEKIRLTWEELDVEDHKMCYYDFVKIYEGPDEESPEIGTYCGAELPAARTINSSVVTIVFSTDNSFNGKGFTIKYTTHCGGEFREDSGILTSPYYPQKYPNEKTCYYEIIQPPEKRIVLSIVDLDIEGHWHSGCYFDHLDIYDGDSENSTKLAELCGGEEKIPADPFYSTHNFMYLQFQVDASYSYRGFKANYSTIDRRCGGLFKSSPGSIISPGAGEGYSNDEECTWTIQAPPGHVIHLSWSSWSLESHFKCRHDYVEIKEEYNGEDLLIGKYCGKTKPAEIITLGRTMTIVFKSDDTVTSEGFVGEYRFIDTSKSCGARYFSSNGAITSPAWPRRYSEERECIWIIEAPTRMQIKLSVESFELETSDDCRYDYLEIRNGAHPTSPLIGKYCGEAIPKTIQSFTNHLYLKFKSDESLAAGGFKIEWDATQRGCGGSLTGSSGDIMSPNYPAAYSTFSFCTWNIAVARGNRIQIVLVDVGFNEDSSCSGDYLEIAEGTNGIIKNKEKYCSASNVSPIELTSNAATVHFRSGFGGGGHGFHLKYNTLCQNKVHGYSGAIESPNFPNNYPPNLNCTWIIDAPTGNKINISFTHFDLEPGNSAREKPCVYDYLDIKEGMYDSANTELGHYCPVEGMAMPPKIVSTQNQVFINFRTDESSHYGGFRLEWIVDGCGGHLREQSGVITSPGYPKVYPTNIDCEWTIEVDYGYSVQINFTDVQTEKENNCIADKVEVWGGEDDAAPKLAEFCHSTSPLTFVSPTNKMFIKLHSDWNEAGRGFTANFEQVPSTCGGRVRAAEGSFHSQNYPMNYPVNQNCEWLLEVDANHLINLTFVDVDLEGSVDCVMDHIKIYDGPTRDHNLLKTFCGKEIPPPIISSTDALLIVMRSDPAQTAKGFRADFKRACGARIVTNGTGFLSTAADLHLQSDEGHNCSWIIAAGNLADHITLAISRLDMACRWGPCEENCTSHVLQVYEGEGTEGPLKGEWCAFKAPPPIVSNGNALTVHLVTYYYSDVSFAATYSALNSACGGHYYAESGTLVSPGYPQSYVMNTECEWTLRTAPGNGIVLIFSKFDIEPSANCDRDYLEIREDSSMGPIVGVYCGNQIDTIRSKKALWLKFRSDDVGTAGGFVADYTFEHGSELSGPSGVIASPLYPHPFTKPDEVTWRITVQSAFLIRIEFDTFHMDTFADDVCGYYDDGLQFFDGYDKQAPQLRNLCGTTLPKSFQSTSNVVFIVFRGDRRRLGNWFKIRYYEVPRTTNKNADAIVEVSQCNEEVALINDKNSSYVITSPGYPEGYNASLHCNWLITSPPGTHLVLNFREINLEETDSCLGDRISVFSGRALSESPPPDAQLLGKYCLNNASHSIVEGTTNIMTVKFETDLYLNRTGFQAEVRRLCGGELSGPNGIIEFNETTRGPSWGWHFQCEWNVTVSRGKTIEVTFVSLDVPKKQEGCGDYYILLKNGQEASSPFLGDGKYCSSDTPEPLMTTSNKLYVKFAALGNQGFYKISYREVGVDCGGQYQLIDGMNEQRFSTPRYPNVPPPYSECVWTFMAPGGQRLSLHFFDRFDLTYSPSCQTEYIEVRDGGTENAELLGAHCGDTAPSTIVTTGNMMYIRYYTNMHVPGNGFRALVTNDEVCGQVLRAPSGVISSPNYPNPYTKGLQCVWWITGLNHHSLKFEFTDLHLPGWRNCNDTDHLSIMEKLPSNETLGEPRTYCGIRNNPGIVETSSNEAIITLHTDGKTVGNYRGFRLNYSSTIGECGGELDSPGGTFHSTGYPNSRLSGIYCSWKITVPAGSQVKLEIIDLDINYEAADPYGVRIYNDHRYKSRITILNTPSFDKVINSSANVMLVAFFAEAGFRGLSAKYSALSPAPCGGIIDKMNGSITLPSDEQYRSRPFFCPWTLVVPIDMLMYDAPSSATLAITITGSLGQQPRQVRRCNYKSKHVMLTDASDRTIGSVCGNLTQEPIIMRSASPVNHLSIMNGTTGGPITVNIGYQWNRCGGIITRSSQTIQAPANATYPRNCEWQVLYSEGQGIVMIFKRINLGSCDKGYIIVRNGGAQSPETGKYCGNIKPDNFTSTSNKLWIEYYALEAPGDFEIELVNVDKACGSSDLNISSPGFPSAYPNKSECVWEFNVESGYHIGLTFVERFSLETSVNCTNDYVEVFDRIVDNEKPWRSLGRVCGRNTPPPFNTTTNQIKVVFHSNDNVRGDGFKAHMEKNCGGIFMASKEIQRIMSPKYPNGYPRNLKCNYTILSPPGKMAIVEFEEFELEQLTPSCTWANLTISNQFYFWKKMEKPYCGTNKPPVQISPKNLQIIFNSYARLTGRGFVFKYLLNECGGEITEEGSLSPPTSSAGLNYYGGLNCTWIIRAPSDKSVSLRFDDFETEYSTRCFHDKVRTYEGSSLNATNLLSTYCGNLTENLPVVKSVGNIMTVNFISDYTKHYKGFKAKVIFTKSIASGCGGPINLTTTVNWRTQVGDSYEDFEDCMWSISAASAKIIKITFKTFDVKDTPNKTVSPQTHPCSGDYLEIRDGRGPHSELIGRYCGTELPPSIVSSRNVLWIRFYTDAGFRGHGVTATLEPMDSPCGESVIKVENTTVTLKSPNHPGDYPLGLACKWILSGPNARDLHILFKNIDMENSKDCEGDMLRLTDRRLNKHIEEGFGMDLIINGKTGSNYGGIGSHKPAATYTFCSKVQSYDYYAGGNIVEVALKSTMDNAQKPRKFELEVSVADCRRNYTSTQGRIYHQGFNNCWTTITVPPGNTISLYFMNFRIYDRPGCVNKYLKVYDGDFNSAVIGTYCGMQIPAPIFSTGNTISLMSNSQSGATWENYDITYTSTDKGKGCGGKIFNYAGKLTSPMFPNIYRSNGTCNWEVSVPRGSKVLLDFTTFDLGSGENCDTHLAVNEASEAGSSSTRYCGGERPAKYKSQSNQVDIQYTTTLNNGGSGWEISFLAIAEDYDDTSNGPNLWAHKTHAFM